MGCLTTVGPWSNPCDFKKRVAKNNSSGHYQSIKRQTPQNFSDEFVGSNDLQLISGICSCWKGSSSTLEKKNNRRSDGILAKNPRSTVNRILSYLFACPEIILRFNQFEPHNGSCRMNPTIKCLRCAWRCLKLADQLTECLVSRFGVD